MDELDKEPDEAHDEEAYCGGKGNSLELCRGKQRQVTDIDTSSKVLEEARGIKQRSAHILRVLQAVMKCTNVPHTSVK